MQINAHKEIKCEEYISDKNVIKRTSAAIKIELENRQILGLSTIVFDRKTKTIYQINADGSRIIVGEKKQKGSVC